MRADRSRTTVAAVFGTAGSAPDSTKRRAASPKRSGTFSRTGWWSSIDGSGIDVENHRDALADPDTGAATAYPPPRRRRLRQASTTTRGADAPSGCPMAMAPPLTLTRSRSISGNSCRQDSTMAANASLISHTAMSDVDSPARRRALRMAGTGATEKRCGSSATVALATTRPSTGTPRSAAACWLPTSRAIAPSLTGEALPAVTLPSGVNAGLSWASFSAVVARPGSTRPASPCRLCPAPRPRSRHATRRPAAAAR